MKKGETIRDALLPTDNPHIYIRKNNDNTDERFLSIGIKITHVKKSS